MSKKTNKAQQAENKNIDMEAKGTETAAETDVDTTGEGEPCDRVADEGKSESDNSAQLSAQVAEWKDKYMRLSAEFDNYRKRTLKEKMDLISSAGEGVIKSLLPVVDDFDRALKAMENIDDVDSVKQGVLLIAQKLGEVLRSHGVSEIPAVGQPLNTDLHEAVAKVPDPQQSGKIIDVVQKGYKMGDKVIRYAKVVVAE